MGVKRNNRSYRFNNSYPDYIYYIFSTREVRNTIIYILESFLKIHQFLNSVVQDHLNRIDYKFPI